MALTLVATAGATNANSYATIAQADAYHERHPYGSTWHDQEVPVREQALVWATALLDRHVEWFGLIASSTQALRWPRTSTADRDGRPVSGATIPAALQDVTAELARWLLESDRTAESEAAAAGSITGLKVGSVEINYGAGGSTSATVDVLPDAVVAMLAPLGSIVQKPGSSGPVRYYRG